MLPRTALLPFTALVVLGAVVAALTTISREPEPQQPAPAPELLENAPATEATPVPTTPDGPTTHWTAILPGPSGVRQVEILLAKSEGEFFVRLVFEPYPLVPQGSPDAVLVFVPGTVEKTNSGVLFVAGGLGRVQTFQVEHPGLPARPVSREVPVAGTVRFSDESAMISLVVDNEVHAFTARGER